MSEGQSVWLDRQIPVNYANFKDNFTASHVFNYPFSCVQMTSDGYMHPVRCNTGLNNTQERGKPLGTGYSRSTF